MRSRTVLSATLATLALTLVPTAWAQQGTGRAPGKPSENPNIRQYRDQNANRDRDKSSTQSETIHGIVAGITLEGEMAYDYKANRGTVVEAAFLTVVGTPVKSSGEMASDRNKASANTNNGGEKSEMAHKMRHNVYMVWLSPKTKVCEKTVDYANNKSNANRNEGDKDQDKDKKDQDKDKKEVTLDRLEVGDHVEIQFNKREDSAGNTVAHQTEQMRQKHGRHRIYMVEATAITIMTPDRDQDRSNSGQKNEKESSR